MTIERHQKRGATRDDDGVGDRRAEGTADLLRRRQDRGRGAGVLGRTLNSAVEAIDTKAIPSPRLVTIMAGITARRTNCRP